MAAMRRGLALVALVGHACAQVRLEGARCGQLTCNLDQYCSTETYRCASCADACNKTNHNYDRGLCEKECQDYIHDVKYVSRAGGLQPGESADLRSVQIQARAALIISSVLLALIVLVFLFKCFKFTKKNRHKFSWKYLRQKIQPSKNRVNQYPTDLTHHNPHADMPKKHELKLEIRNSNPEPKRQQPLNVNELEANRLSQVEKSQGAQTPKTVSTCISNRHPAEDATLDYSYDNMGMNVTPPPAAQAATSHF